LGQANLGLNLHDVTLGLFLHPPEPCSSHPQKKSRGNLLNKIWGEMDRKEDKEAFSKLCLAFPSCEDSGERVSFSADTSLTDGDKNIALQ
jgi:hypothetical protein